MASEPRRKRLDRDELGRRLAEVCLLDGAFTQRSGATRSHVFDTYRFEADPVLLANVARHLAPLVPGDVDVLAGLELGGVPAATALSLATGLPTVFVRKQATSYRTARLVEGIDIDGRRLLVVDDVVSSGGHVVASTQELRERGAIVQHALGVVDRGGADALAAVGVELHALFSFSELVPGAVPTELTAPHGARRAHGEAPARADAVPVAPPTGERAAEPEPLPPAATPLLPRRAPATRTDRKVAPKLVPRRTSEG